MSTAEGEVVPTHPWRRWVARMFDIYVFTMLVGALLPVIVVVIAPGQVERVLALLGASDALTSIGYSMLLLPVAMLLIAGLLTLCGTPGKWLCGLKVVRISDGERPTLRESVFRELMVWVRGLGIGFPVVTLVTQLLSHGDLKDFRQTIWDQRLQLRMDHAPMNAFGIAKLVFAIVAVVAFRLLDMSVLSGFGL